MLQTFDLVQLLTTFYSFSYLTEDYGYFSARTWAYKHNTTTNAIHTKITQQTQYIQT